MAQLGRMADAAASRYTTRMFDRFYLPFVALAAAGVIALACVSPQGLGARAWGPFGHTPVQQTADVQAAIQRENAAALRRAKLRAGLPTDDSYTPYQ